MSTPHPASTTPILTITEGKALIRLARPAEHTRLEPDDLEALIEIYDRIAKDPTIRVLVITGTGKSFSSGFHIGALSERKEGRQKQYDPNAFEKMVDKLEDLRVPTIAALNGGVYGGATDLALACDFRIGVETVRMFMPAARLGILYYQSGLRRYVSRLGLDNAKRLFLTGAPVGSSELLAMGYLTECVPHDQLMSRVEALASEIAANAPLAVAATKKALNDVAAGRLDPPDIALFYATPGAMMYFINGMQYVGYKKFDWGVVGETACADSWGRALSKREP
ncbi:MAG: enoyl-CoA hydratase/isomerase family protein, partial [Proteobacteria bacterium]|nr:enoyl-CoA hydratase/isomerase family protein [Pseudomonadota bacterium]